MQDGRKGTEEGAEQRIIENLTDWTPFLLLDNLFIDPAKEHVSS